MFVRYKTFIESEATATLLNSNLESKTDVSHVRNFPDAPQIDFYDQLAEKYKILSDKPIQELFKGIKNYVHILWILPNEIGDAELKILESLNDAFANNASKDGYLDLIASLADTSYCDIAACKLKQITDFITTNSSNSLILPTLLRSSLIYHIELLTDHSDLSTHFKSAIARSPDLVKWLIDCLESIDEENQANLPSIYDYLWNTAVTIIMNAASHPDFKKIEDKERLYKALKPLTKSNDIELKLCSIMTFAFMLNESEFSAMHFTDDLPEFVEALSNTLKNLEHRYVGFSANEITEAIGYLANSEKNKDKLVDLGVVPLLEELVTDGSDEEKSSAARALWMLSFSEHAKATIRKTGKCVSALQKLTNSTEKSVKTNATGALWEINEDERVAQETVKPKIERTKSQMQQRRIFISYQHAYQSVVLTISETLRDAGFHVWVDVDEMAGRTMMTAIADGIERADLVLICMSRSYKDSPSCRSEGEYTFAKQKTILPLMLERYYKPDGWLGLLVGAKHYINFDGKFEFTEAISMLLRAIHTQLEPDAGADQPDGNVIVPVKSTETFAIPPAKKKELGIEEVKQWVRDNNLECIFDLVDGMDGKALKNLRKLKDEAPEYFYQTLQKEYNLKMKDVHRLFSAMASLR